MAAIFDFLISNQDRAAGGANWVATNEGDRPTLRLVDHGHSFGYQDGALNSVWAQAKFQQVVPDEHVEALQRFVQDAAAHASLTALLGADAEAVLKRAQELLDGDPI